MSLTEEQKNKAESLKDFLEKAEIDPQLPMYEVLCAIHKELKMVNEKEMPEKHKVEILGAELLTIKGEPGNDGHTPTDEELTALIKPLIPEVEDGHTPTKEELLALIKPLIPKVKDGETPSDERLLDLIQPLIPVVKNGEPGTPGKDGSPDTPEEVRDKLASLEDDNRLDISAIKGVEDLEKKIISQVPRGGGGVSAMAVAAAFKYIAHTEEPVGTIDGVNTTYTVKNNIWWIAGFTLNKANVAELPNFTYANRTITFASALPAAYSGTDFEVKYIGS